MPWVRETSEDKARLIARIVQPQLLNFLFLLLEGILEFFQLVLLAFERFSPSDLGGHAVSCEQTSYLADYSLSKQFSADWLGYLFLIGIPAGSLAQFLTETEVQNILVRHISLFAVVSPDSAGIGNVPVDHDEYLFGFERKG